MCYETECLQESVSPLGNVSSSGGVDFLIFGDVSDTFIETKEAPAAANSRVTVLCEG